MKVYIIMGVSGVGKTTIGKLLSKVLQIPFYDADDFQPEDNIKKMESGHPLNDKDRQAWLQILSRKIKTWNKSKGAILACSALKEAYRKQLQVIPKNDLNWIFLYSDYKVILERLGARKDHYFKSNLLKSQYEILEYPEYGIQINVNTTKENIIKKIMKALKKSTKATIGVLGLGVMGKSLALNLASNGIEISVYNREVKEKEVAIAKNFAKSHEAEHQFPWFDNLEGFVASLELPRTILVMVNAGKPVDMVIEGLLPFLSANDLIIDGGNSHFKDSVKRAETLKKRGILYMGLGISGGEKGALNGPSLMPGGTAGAYNRMGTILEKIAAKDKDGNPCCAYIGPQGAGHFVKMLHNGIEYGEMQLIAEMYSFARVCTRCSREDIATLFEGWNKEMKSYLLEITIQILRKKEGEAVLLDLILDTAEQKGTGGWSTNAALELGVPFHTITAAVMARNMSAKKTERLAAAKLYKKEENKSKPQLAMFSEALYKAYKAGSIINHAIGFDVLNAASKRYQWNLNLSEIARIWTNGCIIRSAFMVKAVEYFKEAPDQHLLVHPEIVSRIKIFKAALIEINRNGLQDEVAMPVLSAAANYLLSYTTGQSSANLIQAQRDYFGAHTYERTDKPRGSFFHTQWEQEEEQ